MHSITCPRDTPLILPIGPAEGFEASNAIVRKPVWRNNDKRNLYLVAVNHKRGVLLKPRNRAAVVVSNTRSTLPPTAIAVLMVVNTI